MPYGRAQKLGVSGRGESAREIQHAIQKAGTRENLRVLSARARARPALVKRGASGPCPKKYLKIFLHRARVHDMCIFSSISSFYFNSILNMYSVVCIPFNFFYCEYPVPYLLLRQNLSFEFNVYFIARFNSDHLINQLFHAQA